MSEYAAYVGWDWADREHVIELREPGSESSEKMTLKGSAGGSSRMGSGDEEAVARRPNRSVRGDLARGGDLGPARVPTHCALSGESEERGEFPGDLLPESRYVILRALGYKLLRIPFHCSKERFPTTKPSIRRR